jgi:hypothetical protein
MSVRMERLGSQLTDFHETWYLRSLRKYVEKSQVTRYSCQISMKLEFFSKYFRKILKYQILWKSVKWEPSSSLRMDGHTEDSNSRFWQFYTDIIKFFICEREVQGWCIASEFFRSARKRQLTLHVGQPHTNKTNTSGFLRSWSLINRQNFSPLLYKTYMAGNTVQLDSRIPLAFFISWVNKVRISNRQGS